MGPCAVGSVLIELQGPVRSPAVWVAIVAEGEVEVNREGAELAIAGIAIVVTSGFTLMRALRTGRMRLGRSSTTFRKIDRPNLFRSNILGLAFFFLVGVILA